MRIIPHDDKKLIEKYNDHLIFCQKIGRPNIVFIEDDQGAYRYQENKFINYIKNNIDLIKMWNDYYRGEIDCLDLIYFYQDSGYSLCGFEQIFNTEIDRVLGVKRDPQTGEEITRRREDEDWEFLSSDHNLLFRVPVFTESSIKILSGRRVGFKLQWNTERTGFGEFIFYLDDNGQIACENETMSKNFVKQALCSMVDTCEFKG